MLCSPVSLHDLRIVFLFQYVLTQGRRKSLRLQTSNRLASNLFLCRNKALKQAYVPFNFDLHQKSNIALWASINLYRFLFVQSYSIKSLFVNISSNKIFEIRILKEQGIRRWESVEVQYGTKFRFNLNSLRQCPSVHAHAYCLQPH